MNYCIKGQWVTIYTTGHQGIIDTILWRRDHKRDGRVIVQCGAGGPFVETDMGTLVEMSQKEIDIAEGVRYHED